MLAGSGDPGLLIWLGLLQRAARLACSQLLWRVLIQSYRAIVRQRVRWLARCMPFLVKLIQCVLQSVCRFVLARTAVSGAQMSAEGSYLNRAQRTD